MSGAGEEVVIVGAGPSGLAMAIELGMRGIGCRVVERNIRAGHAPRAKTTHIRTREHLRRWGIADRLAEASPFGIDYPANVVFVTRLGGHGIARIENAMYCDPAPDERYSEHAQWIPQYKLEAVLLEHAASLPAVTIEHGREFLGFEQDEDGVAVRLRDVASGEVQQIAARYLIGADGAGSEVRKAIGARMEGRHGLSRNYNTIFRAPGLAEAHPHGPAIMYWQMNRDAPSLIGPMDRDDIWFFMPTGIGPDIRYGREEIAALIRRSTGIDLEYEILSSDEWVASRLLATHYRKGRAFLVGDACHLHPPFGGYGMNMGIADSVDLGWKIAARLQGWGGEALLESYEAERRPAHVHVLDEAEANHRTTPDRLIRDGLEDPGPEGEAVRAELGATIGRVKEAEFHAMGVTLGFCYQNSPVICADADTAAWRPSLDYRPSGAPGCLAPHCWLAEGSSLYDLFGPGLTLIGFGAKTANGIERARMEADRAGIPLEAILLEDPALARLYGARLVLIRPDQYVAWRGNAWPGAAVLAQATGRDIRNKIPDK